MFGDLTYVGYTLLFCVPALVLLWLRAEFFHVLRRNLGVIAVSTAVLVAYGAVIWPLALKYGAWAYDPAKITGWRLFGYVYVDDVLWWAAIGWLVSSFVVLSRHYADAGVDLFFREIKALTVSFIYAFRGLAAIPRERNATIHVAVAAFVLLEGWLLRISRTEWLFVIAAIGLVLALELVNSAVERLSSKVSPEHDEEIRVIKDTAAAAVLLASGAAVGLGLVIFFSRIVALVF